MVVTSEALIIHKLTLMPENKSQSCAQFVVSLLASVLRYDTIRYIYVRSKSHLSLAYVRETKIRKK